jgi:hypothetical protein
MQAVPMAMSERSHDRDSVTGGRDQQMFIVS